MNTASMLLKKADLLSFICASENPAATMHLSSTHDGARAGVINFPTCGNWINKPVDPAAARNEAPAPFRAVAVR